MPPSITDRAESLARAGQVREAGELLYKAAAAGDANALFTLASWLLAGDFLPRNLPLSRRLFGQAATAGHAEAASIHLAFVANSTGAAPDWRQAMLLLERAASGDPDAAGQLALIRAMDLDAEGNPRTAPPREELSRSPYVAHIPALLTEAEADYLVKAATPLLRPAVVVDPATGRQVPNPIRTSESAAFPLALERPVIHAINRRLAAASGTDVAQGEPLQVLRYRPGQEYRAHMDALPAADNQRVATVLVYLNDDYEGGETHFFANRLTVRGRKGDALLFANVTADGRPDELARHAGLPVTKREKWLASRWIRARPLDLG